MLYKIINNVKHKVAMMHKVANTEFSAVSVCVCPVCRYISHLELLEWDRLLRLRFLLMMGDLDRV